MERERRDAAQDAQRAPHAVAGDAATDGVELPDQSMHLRTRCLWIELVDQWADVLGRSVRRVAIPLWRCRSHGAASRPRSSSS